MQFARIVVCAAAAVLPLLGAATAPQFQDYQEYKMVAAIQIETNPARRVVLLERWAQLYPESAFRQERWNELIMANRALGHPRKMRDLTRKMIADNPRGFGNYWLTVLTINLQDTSPRALEEGQRAASTLLGTAAQIFSASNCPASVALSDWYKERDRQMSLAHRTLGWVALEQKRYDDAVAELTRVIDGNPADAEAFFWLGSAFAAEEKPELQSKALYCFARSLSISGKNALLPEARRLVQPYFERAYTAVKGSRNGMSEYIEQAGANFKRE